MFSYQRKRKLPLLMVLMVLFLFIPWTNALGQDALPEDGAYFDEVMGEDIAQEIPTVTARGKVTRVLEEREDQIESSGGAFENTMQYVEVKIINGPYKNQIVTAEYALSLAFTEDEQNVSLKVGDEVLLTMELDDGGSIVYAYIYNVARDKSLLLLVILFAGVILAIGRLKGLRTLITLILTVLAIFYVLLPLILRGFDPIFVTVWVCMAITAVTLLLVSGPNKKTLSALIGTIGGVVAAGTIAKIIGTMAKLTGLGDEESMMLLYIPQNIKFDYKGLLFAGIIIGALGAAMDVGLSLSSAMFELKEQNPKLRRGAHIKAGMNIGRDMMATMSNTLILAYVGGSLPLLILLFAYQMPFIEMINQDGLASEIVRSLAGSVGLILTIPITAVVSALLCEKDDPRR